MTRLESGIADVRYALRLFTRAPGFALGVAAVAARQSPAATLRAEV